MGKKSILQRVILALLFCAIASAAEATNAENAATVSVLCYHEVDCPGNPFSVTSAQLEGHIQALKEDGIRFLSLDEYLLYTQGKLPLSAPAVMLSFDDGYRSFYTKAYPLLQKYEVPAMLAIVSAWTEGIEHPAEIGALATWEELREMEQSGLVTVVTHSHAMHKGQPVNPQGDKGSIANHRLYLSGRYETDGEYSTRIEQDMKRGQELFREKLGHPSKAFVWPYGANTSIGIALAKEHGMACTFGLDGGVNAPSPEYAKLARRSIIYGPEATNRRIRAMVTNNKERWDGVPIRMAQVDLDAVYDDDPVQFQTNLAHLKERLRTNNINVVAIQAFADPDGDGNVDAVYFYNTQVPVRADILEDVQMSLRNQGAYTVAWLPTLTYQAFVRDEGANLIQTEQPAQKGWYRRVTPFDPTLPDKVAMLYYELAAYTSVSGILLQDDLYMNDFEDASVYGRAAYERLMGEPWEKYSPKDEKKAMAWAEKKREALDNIANVAKKSFTNYRPDGTVMRDIYTAPVTKPWSKAWFAQDFEKMTETYDYTVVMAYPYMDKAEQVRPYLEEIVRAVRASGKEDRVIFKVQSYDWNKKQFLTEKAFNDEMDILKDLHVRNRGFYPDTPVDWKDKTRAKKDA